MRMCRPQNELRSRTQAGVKLLLIGLLAALPAGAASGGDASGRNGPGGPQGGRIAVGNLIVSSPANCSVAYSLQVQTDIGSGNDDFELRIYDDAVLVQTQALSAPADGAVHALSATLRLEQPVSQANPGVGIYLVDSGVILDFVDPADVTCGFVEIPTLDTTGALLLGGLLFASALVLLRRHRSHR